MKKLSILIFMVFVVTVHAGAVVIDGIKYGNTVIDPRNIRSLNSQTDSIQISLPPGNSLATESSLTTLKNKDFATQATLNSLNSKFYSSSAVMSVSSTITTSSVLLLPANPNRKGLILYNNSANSIYISFDTTANSSNHMTLILATFTQYVMAMPIYTGPISGIRNSGTGTVLITELQ